MEQVEDWYTSPKEFVAMNEQGKEVEWIDPVCEFEEKPDCWIINNTYSTYTVTKQPGYKYVIRDRVTDNDD